MRNVETIEGIGQAYGKKLLDVGIKTTDQLLEKGETKKGRKKLAEETGLSEKLILTWVNHCDLFRIKGIGPQYADLLEAAGVDTVPELATRNPENLLTKLTEINDEKNLVKSMPYLKQVKRWVEEAKHLPKVVLH